MTEELDAADVAARLLTGVSALVRRVRHVRTGGELTMPERTALSLLDREGPTTSSALARQVQITAQAMGATVRGLQARGLVGSSRDPRDGRRVVLAATAAGRQALEDRRNARTELVARALAEGFTPAERARLAAAAPLLERLARAVPARPDQDADR